MYIYIDAGFEKINLICKVKQPLLPKRVRSHVITAKHMRRPGASDSEVDRLAANIIPVSWKRGMCRLMSSNLYNTIHCFHNRVESHCVFDEYSVIGGFDCTHRVPSM